MQGYTEPPGGEESDYGSDFSPSEEDALLDLLSKAAGDARGLPSIDIDGPEDGNGFRRIRATAAQQRDHVQYAELSTAASEKQGYDFAVEIDGHRRDEPTSTFFGTHRKISLTDWEALSRELSK